MIKRLLLAIAGIVLLAGAARPAAATPIYEITWAGSNFFGFSTPPIQLMLGRVTLALDLNQLVFDSTSGITLDFLNVPLDSPIGYTYAPGADLLLLGGMDGAVSGASLSGDDFVFELRGIGAGTPYVGLLTYSDGLGHHYQAGLSTFHISQVGDTTAVTPIPAALPLFVSALGGLGFFGWRRRKSAA